MRGSGGGRAAGGPSSMTSFPPVVLLVPWWTFGGAGLRLLTHALRPLPHARPSMSNVEHRPRRVSLPSLGLANPPPPNAISLSVCGWRGGQRERELERGFPGKRSFPSACFFFLFCFFFALMLLRKKKDSERGFIDQLSDDVRADLFIMSVP